MYKRASTPVHVLGVQGGRAPPRAGEGEIRTVVAASVQGRRGPAVAAHTAQCCAGQGPHCAGLFLLWQTAGLGIWGSEVLGFRA